MKNDMEITAFVANVFLHGEHEPITYDDAFTAISEWIKDGVALPKGITARKLADEYNRMVDDDTRQREHAEAPEPSRAAQMANVARSAMHLLRIARPNRDIRIEYHRADDESNENLTQWQREKFHLWLNDEYFMVWDDAPEWDAHGPDLLYVVNVSADSLLTAAAELFELLHRKF